MRIDNEVKLDYSDVLIVPQRSSLSSRSEVILEREFRFPHSPLTVSGIGVIAANMDTVGTMEMAREFKKHKMFVALHKHYAVPQLLEFFSDQSMWDTAFYTIGTAEKDLEKLKIVTAQIYNKFNWSNLTFDEIEMNGEFVFPKMICLDVANGYTQQFVDHLKAVRSLFPKSIIMAGNVCTPNMAEELILSGADICKIGIGQGCFIAGTKIKTKNGYKNIEEITTEDKVLTHRGVYKPVVGTMTRKEEERLYTFKFQGKEFTCTGNHEIYVLNKKYQRIVSDDNIHEYAEWIEAENITKDYFLLKIKE
jgi:GMP reductase